MDTKGRLLVGSHNRNEFVLINAAEMGRENLFFQGERMVRNSKEEGKIGQSKAYPEFFKPFMAQSSSHRLLIPTAFIASIDKVVPDQAILRNRLGRLWLVDVAKTDNGVYYLNGWENFVRDNSLEFGEFMVFRYNGNCDFYVKLFDKFGCEKKDSTSFASIGQRISFTKKEEVEGKPIEKEKVREVDEEDGDKGKDVDDEDDDDDDNEEEEEDDNNNSDSDEEEDYYDEEEAEEEEEKEKEKEKAKANGRGHKNKGLLHLGQCKATAADVNSRGQNERTPSVNVNYCSNINVGKYVQPENPYFVTRKLVGKRGKVYVPTDLLTDFNIQLLPKMIFRDQYGRKWPGKVAVWKDGRSWIGGWNTFCKWNHVTSQDICICEFMQGRNCKRNLIQVHIVRG